MVNLMIHKECFLFNTKDSIKTKYYGCGMSDSDSILKFKELKFINGNVSI